MITETLVNNRTFVIPYLLLLAFSTLMLIFWEKEEIFFMLHDIHTPFGDLFFRYFTHFGDGFFAVAIVLALCFFHFGRAAFMAIAFVVTGLIAQVLKKLVFSDALRPSGWQWSNPEYLLQMVEGVKYHNAYSFPSGHTITAFTLFFGLTLIVGRKRLGYLFFLIAVLAAYSRVYLGQHFFEDVYFGSVIAILCTMIIWILFFRQMNKAWAQKSLLRLKK